MVQVGIHGDGDIGAVRHRSKAVAKRGAEPSPYLRLDDGASRSAVPLREPLQDRCGLVPHPDEFSARKWGGEYGAVQALVNLLDVAGLVHGGGDDDDVPPRALGRRKCHSAWTGSELG
jgi:hypothetical protein